MVANQPPPAIREGLAGRTISEVINLLGVIGFAAAIINVNNSFDEIGAVVVMVFGLIATLLVMGTGLFQIINGIEDWRSGQNLTRTKQTGYFFTIVAGFANFLGTGMSGFVANMASLPALSAPYETVVMPTLMGNLFGWGVGEAITIFKSFYSIRHAFQQNGNLPDGAGLDLVFSTAKITGIVLLVIANWNLPASGGIAPIQAIGFAFALGGVLFNMAYGFWKANLTFASDILLGIEADNAEAQLWRLWLGPSSRITENLVLLFGFASVGLGLVGLVNASSLTARLLLAGFGTIVSVSVLLAGLWRIIGGGYQIVGMTRKLDGNFAILRGSVVVAAGSTALAANIMTFAYIGIPEFAGKTLGLALLIWALGEILAIVYQFMRMFGLKLYGWISRLWIWSVKTLGRKTELNAVNTYIRNNPVISDMEIRYLLLGVSGGVLNIPPNVKDWTLDYVTKSRVGGDDDFNYKLRTGIVGGLGSILRLVALGLTIWWTDLTVDNFGGAQLDNLRPLSGLIAFGIVLVIELIVFLIVRFKANWDQLRINRANARVNIDQQVQNVQGVLGPGVLTAEPSSTFAVVGASLLFGTFLAALGAPTGAVIGWFSSLTFDFEANSPLIGTWLGAAIGGSIGLFFGAVLTIGRGGLGILGAIPFFSMIGIILYTAFSLPIDANAGFALLFGLGTGFGIGLCFIIMGYLTGPQNGFNMQAASITALVMIVIIAITAAIFVRSNQSSTMTWAIWTIGSVNGLWVLFVIMLFIRRNWGRMVNYLIGRFFG